MFTLQPKNMGESITNDLCYKSYNDTNHFDYNLKLLTLGNSAVGKTSLLFQYTDGAFSGKFVSTVGIDFRTKHILHQFPNQTNNGGPKDCRIQLQLWDTAGQERFRSLSTTFLRDAMGFLLVFDITNEMSFNQIHNWVSLLRDHAYCEQPDMILVGNKVDLSARRSVPRERAQELADELGIPYIEASALTGENVHEVIRQLLDMILHRIESADDTTEMPAKRNRSNGAPSKSQKRTTFCDC